MAPYYISLDALILTSIGIGIIALSTIIVSIRSRLKNNKEYQHLPRHEGHAYYWIEGGILFESYSTHRGLRSHVLMQIDGFPDTDECDQNCITKIEETCQTNVN